MTIRTFFVQQMLLSDKKKISSFGRTVAEIFNFYSGKVTFGPPCISIAIPKLLLLFFRKFIIKKSTIQLPFSFSTLEIFVSSFPFFRSINTDSLCRTALLQYFSVKRQSHVLIFFH